jgi:predicted PhzF superfamily epimerase YddE/YHI9
LLVPFYQVDAFANRRFGGNPAAVMLLERFVDDVSLRTAVQNSTTVAAG